jgi:hypothetical protein
MLVLFPHDRADDVLGVAGDADLVELPALVEDRLLIVLLRRGAGDESLGRELLGVLVPVGFGGADVARKLQTLPAWATMVAPETRVSQPSSVVGERSLAPAPVTSSPEPFQYMKAPGRPCGP